jgi:hypothetical protein
LDEAGSLGQDAVKTLPGGALGFGLKNADNGLAAGFDFGVGPSEIAAIELAAGFREVRQGVEDAFVMDRGRKGLGDV